MSGYPHHRVGARPPLIERLLAHGWSVMLYDGNCVLCSSAARYISKRSTRSLLAFCAMQSDAGREALAALGKSLRDYETVIVLEENKVLERGDAALRLFEHMLHPWPHIARLVRRIPGGLRDAIYRVVARYRFRILARRDECMLIAESARRKFIL